MSHSYISHDLLGASESESASYVTKIVYFRFLKEINSR
jgi:hypothetical protein